MLTWGITIILVCTAINVILALLISKTAQNKSGNEAYKMSEIIIKGYSKSDLKVVIEIEKMLIETTRECKKYVDEQIGSVYAENDEDPWCTLEFDHDNSWEGYKGPTLW